MEHSIGLKSVNCPLQIKGHALTIILLETAGLKKCGSLPRAVEIACLTCLTWSHFIHDKLKMSIYTCPWTSTNV